MADPIIMDGKQLAKELRREIKQRVQALADNGVTPCLAAILVGDDPASDTYVRMKAKTCEKLGMKSERIVLPAETTTGQLLQAIEGLNERADVDGILLQHPVPSQIDERRCFDAIALNKDVDGVTTEGFGRVAMGAPAFECCTPRGIMKLLDRYEVGLVGAEAAVIGRSPILGKPMAAMLLNRHATVTVCHSRTRNLPDVVRRADLVVAAVGRPKFVTAEMVKEGAWVIDAGYNEGNIGDVDYDAVAPKCKGITPVPGGVGPMTIAVLMENTVESAEARAAAGARK